MTASEKTDMEHMLREGNASFHISMLIPQIGAFSCIENGHILLILKFLFLILTYLNTFAVFNVLKKHFLFNTLHSPDSVFNTLLYTLL